MYTVYICPVFQIRTVYTDIRAETSCFLSSFVETSCFLSSFVEIMFSGFRGEEVENAKS